MPKDIHQRDTAQQRSSRLLLAMGIIVLPVSYTHLDVYKRQATTV